MGGFKKYIKTEFKLEKFKLEHDDVSDFYISCWQRNRMILPLLCINAVIFFGCLAIVLASAILTGMSINFGYWPIYMTHWGIMINTLASGFALAVSCRVYLKGPIVSSFSLPWYVKAYWVLFNTAIPIAFFITIYYWVFLTSLDEDFAVNFVLDFMIHGTNSILMFILLMVSRHPMRLLHFYCPVMFGLIYMMFTLIYYFAGGTDPFGNEFIYPTVDWSQPGITLVLVLITALIIIIVHLIVVGLAALRDFLTRRYRRNSMSLSISNIAYN